ncbi:MAG: MarR family EPS-associated transcriptional regulator, partial [Pseudomonadota bacterium]
SRDRSRWLSFGFSSSNRRTLNRELGVSLGAVNYCLTALVEKGQIKVRNFRASNNKMRSAYMLTPRGLAERVALTGRFLQRKRQEFEALRREIEALSVCETRGRNE